MLALTAEHEQLLKIATDHINMWSLRVVYPSGMVILNRIIFNLVSSRDIDELVTRWPCVGEV
jgi:hypothetical protein